MIICECIQSEEEKILVIMIYFAEMSFEKWKNAQNAYKCCAESVLKKFQSMYGTPWIFIFISTFIIYYYIFYILFSFIIIILLVHIYSYSISMKIVNSFLFSITMKIVN